MDCIQSGIRRSLSNRVLIMIVSVLLVILLSPNTVWAQPAQFKICGEALINGIPVEDGTPVSAHISGSEVDTTLTTGSNYCLEINGEPDNFSGKTISFIINEGDKADEMVTWQADQSIDLDLNVTISAESYVNFADPNLEALIREAIGKETGDISQFDLEAVTSIDGSSFGISDLRGLEYCINLTDLYLPSNGIRDISPLSSLSKLTSLTLSSNEISDISPLSNLNSLSYLHLGQNRISDITSLSKLTNLTKLYMSSNRIINIPSFTNLTNLSNLSLSNNRIEDISSLSDLTNLKALWLYDNKIEDISALSSLSNLASLDLRQNQISNISSLENLDVLTNLKMDANNITNTAPLSDLPNIEQLTLDENQISDITPIGALVTLRRISLDSNEITDLSPISNLTNLSELSLQNNQIIDISPLIDSGLADNGRLVSIDLTSNPLSFSQQTEYIPQLEEKGIAVEWGSLPDPAPVDTPTPTPTTSSDGSDEDKVAGIVGGIFLLSCIGIILFYILQRRKHAQMVSHIKQKLNEWELEGYDVSEFKNRWFG